LPARPCYNDATQHSRSNRQARQSSDAAPVPKVPVGATPTPKAARAPQARMSAGVEAEARPRSGKLRPTAQNGRLKALTDSAHALLDTAVLTPVLCPSWPTPVQITPDAHAIQSHAAPILRDATPVWWIYEPKRRGRGRRRRTRRSSCNRPSAGWKILMENLEKCRKISFNGPTPRWGCLLDTRRQARAPRAGPPSVLGPALRCMPC
jgi:hypothetical protein